MYASELLVHSWDLAVASEQSTSCGKNLASAALEGARSFLHVEQHDVMGAGNPFGEEQVVRHGATGIERLAALDCRPLGCRPLDWQS